MHTPISPSPAPLAPGGAAAAELSLAAQAVAGLPHHVNDSAVYQNQLGYWCQADAVFIPASNAETAIAYYRQRLNAGSIAVGHNQYCDRLLLELSEQKAVAALDAATARAEAAEHKLAVSEYHLDRACQTKACFDQLELNGAISAGDVEELLARLPRNKRTMPPYDPPKAPAAPSPGRGDDTSSL